MRKTAQTKPIGILEEDNPLLRSMRSQRQTDRMPRGNKLASNKQYRKPTNNKKVYKVKVPTYIPITKSKA